MTDEQIIKALECCATDDGDDCFQCPYGNIVYKPGNGGCVNRCRKKALDLISRQKARIKELEEKHAEDERVLNDRVQESVNAVSKADQKYICTLERSIAAKDVERERLLQKLQQAQSEAIKEFAERLKERYEKHILCSTNILNNEIDSLVKEMTEE